VLGWQPGWMADEPLAATDAWRTLTNNAPEPGAPHGRFLVFWLGNFGILPFLTGALALALLRLLTGRPVSASAAWAAAAAGIAVTPLLGLSASYQRETFSAFLIGTSIAKSITVAIIAVTAIIIGALLHVRNARDFGLRWLLFGFSALFVLDALFTAGNTLDSRFPLLRANAIPLVAATALLLAILIRLARRREPSLWPAAFVFPALFLFFLCCNVKFAPWAWDNTKIMIWAYLIVLPFLWEHLLARWRLWARIGALGLLFFSGFIGLLGGLDRKHEGYQIARLSELDAVAAAVSHIPVTETFAAAPTHNHPLLLAGRKMLLGFPGHLGSHGIQYAHQQSDLDSLMNGARDWRILAAEHGIRYLYVGPVERSLWPNSSEAWRNGAEVIASGDWGEIFDLEMPPLPVAP
jgi:MFS family permease